MTIDTSVPGWFRLLVAVDSPTQDWNIVSWHRTRAEAETAQRRYIAKALPPETLQPATCNA